MNSLLEILCDAESNQAAYSRIESCSDYREAVSKALSLEKEIVEANPNTRDAIYNLDAAYLEAQAALEKNGYKIGMLDGFNLAMEMLGRGDKLHKGIAV